MPKAKKKNANPCALSALLRAHDTACSIRQEVRDVHLFLQRNSGDVMKFGRELLKLCDDLALPLNPTQRGAVAQGKLGFMQAKDVYALKDQAHKVTTESPYKKRMAA